MSNTPKVTVLMPVYDAAKYLREAIDSILAQSFRNFEFLVIDDGSTDDSRAIIESYEEGLRIVDTAVDPDSHWQQRLGGRLAALARVLESLGPRMSLHFQAWGVVAGEPGSQERLYGFLRDFHSARGLEIAEDIREGQRAGEFRADADAGRLAEGIIALLSGFLYRATFDPDAATSGHLHEAFSTFVRGLASDSAPPAAAPLG